MKKYQLLVCGGTFDLLHNGHKSFLKTLFSKSERVIIGLTSDSYILSNKNNNAENFKIREKHLISFINSIDEPLAYEIVRIDNIYGPLLDSSLTPDAIAVTKETEKGATMINEKRKEMGLPLFPVISLEMEKAEDGSPISSTRIRKGEISRQGRLYVKPQWRNKNLTLPEDLRIKFSHPLGELIQKIPYSLDKSKVICVGDVTVKKFNEQKIGQFLSIFDFKVQRENKFSKIEELGYSKDTDYEKIKNPKGTISSDLFNLLRKVFEQNSSKTILVDGEEDLAVAGVILLAPLGFTVFYGQPNKGLVKVLVTEKVKDKIFDLVNKFHLE